MLMEGCRYSKSQSVIIVTIIPAITPTIGVCSLESSLAAGTSSSIAMTTIMPPTTAKTKPITASERNGMRTTAARHAPMTPVSLEKKDQRKAFFLFAVA